MSLIRGLSGFLRRPASSSLSFEDRVRVGRGRECFRVSCRDGRDARSTHGSSRPPEAVFGWRRRSECALDPTCWRARHDPGVRRRDSCSASAGNCSAARSRRVVDVPIPDRIVLGTNACTMASTPLSAEPQRMHHPVRAKRVPHRAARRIVPQVCGNAPLRSTPVSPACFTSG